MSKIITLAKRWNNKPTHYNQVQFLEAFNELDTAEQYKAVLKGGELSKILVGWTTTTRLEIEEEMAQCE